jgi:hypothetical protein
MLRDHRESKEPPHGRNRARDRAWRQTFVHKAVDEPLEVVAVKVFNRPVEARGEFSKTLEIAAVTFERVIGEAPLDAQVREIRIDEIVAG